MRGLKRLGIIKFVSRHLYDISGTSEQSVSQHVKRLEAKLRLYVSLRTRVKEYRQSHPGIGLRKLYDQLNPEGIGRDKFIDVMQTMGMQLAYKRNPQKTTIPGFLRFANKIKGILIWKENQVWQTDITYYPIRLETYYIIFIIDIYTKYIKSYKVSKSMHAYHNVECLRQAIKESGKIDGLIHHSDCGAQFTSIDYLNLLTDNAITISMGVKGQDNAYAERINGIIKNEYLKYRKIETYKQLKRWTKQAVQHYNTIRIHRNLPKGMSSKKFKEKLLSLTDQERPKVIVYADGNSAARKDPVFLSSLTKKDLQDHICPIKWN